MSAGKASRLLVMGAVAGVLASSAYVAAPGWAAPDVTVADAGLPDAGLPEAGPSGAGLSDAGLAEAVQRDLGLTPAEFRAAAERAAVADGSELAVSTEQLFQAYLREVGPEGLQAVMAADGKFIIRTGGITSPESRTEPTVEHGSGDSGTAPGKIDEVKVSPAEFASRYANVELDGGTPLAPEADLPGGLGYHSDFGFVCSTGFSVFDPAGLPAVLTAGHCASDGAAETATLQLLGEPAGLLGRFGFSQFGGPGNSMVLRPDTPEDPGNVGTDIAVLESLRQDLDPLPAASTWGDPSQPGSDVKIIGTAEPVVGMPVCRSGRTSAWSCGTVDAVGIFVVPGPGYWTDSADVRAFNGFLSYGIQSSGGDSGGPYVSGNYAVGTHAAGDTPDKYGNVIRNFAVGASLQDSLAVLPGYGLELFLNKPLVASPASGGTVESGQTIVGTVPAAPASAVASGSTVRVTVQGRDPFEVPVDDAGNWSFAAPAGQESLRFTAETWNGFSASGTSSFEFAPAAAPPATPAEPVAQAPDPAVDHSAQSGPAPADQPAADQPAPGPAEPAVLPASVTPGPAAAAPAPAAPAPTSLAATGRNRGNQGYAANLADTGASALLPAAGAAAAAIVVGGVLMVLVRRRKRHNP